MSILGQGILVDCLVILDDYPLPWLLCLCSLFFGPPKLRNLGSCEVYIKNISCVKVKSLILAQRACNLSQIVRSEERVKFEPYHGLSKMRSRRSSLSQKEATLDCKGLNQSKVEGGLSAP